MDHKDLPPRGSFTSKFGVIAAAAGSAIGLGNIWRFPYVVGENGGGAFLVVYLLFIIGIGIPVMMSEFVIGRRSLRNPYGAFKKLAPGKPWFLVGLMGVGAAFMILAFYSAVAGWTLEYLFQSVTNAFEGKSSEELTGMFDAFREGSIRPILWMLIFMAMTAWIILAGVQKGIEKYTKVLMPLLLVLIIILDIRAVTLPGASEGLSFLFKPDFSKITG
ncbi:MAG: sodium-dependent transporter, partial [Bacteroidales bacterium]|nr:sodium-dependent transporter [Bacteroidales bacterium]